MNKPLSFVHEGVRYTTLFCDDEFLRTALEPDSNVANCAKIISSGGLNVAFKKNFGMQVRDIPLIENAEIIRNGNIFVVTGDVTIKGVTRRAKITATGTYLEADEDEEKPTEVVEEKPVEVVEEKPIEKVEETVEVVEEIPDETSQEIVEEKTVPVVEKKETMQGIAAEAATTEESVKGNDEPATELTRDKLFESSEGIRFMPKNKPAEVKKDELLIGGETNNTVGVFLQGEMYNRRYRGAADRNARFRRMVNNVPVQNVTVEKPVVKEIPKVVENDYAKLSDEVTTKAPIVDEPKCEDAFTSFMKNRPLNEFCKEEPVEEINPSQFKEPVEEKIPEKVVSPTSAKTREEVFNKLPEDIKEVIKDIPDDILGSITEFTMKPVDLKKLKNNGTHYCIDGRWHKCGNWFCIDVVCRTARVFYNSKTRAIVEIPIETCKEWLAAV